MNFFFKITLFTLLLSTITLSCNSEKQNSFYHVLMIEFSKEANINEITQEILLFKEIPSVVDVEFGKIEQTPKNKIQNFTYCLVLKFNNKQGLQEYLDAPYHQKIYKKHKPFIANIYTADFNPISLKE